MTPFISTEQFHTYLDGLGQFRMRLGLERMGQSLRNLGLTPPPYAIARVVGTNGKGSVAWMLARIAAAHGLRVGLYTSPHFISPKERIMLLDGRQGPQGPRMPGDDEWLQLARDVLQAGPAALPELIQNAPNDAGRLELEGLTYFEFLTAMAALHFSCNKVDLAVLEAGLGARCDATAAFTAELACITPIGLDHENILGKGVQAIAAEKAYALKQGAALAVSAPQRPDAWQELEKASREGGTPLTALQDAPPLALDVREHLRLPGSFQADNARLALAGWQLLAERRGCEVSQQACARGLAATQMPGRLQFASAREGEAPLLLDGAHNEDGLRVLGQALQERSLRPQCCVAGFMADKDLERLLPLLMEITEGPIIFPAIPEVPRAAAPEDLARRTGLRGRTAGNVVQALELAMASCAVKGPQAPPVLVCGSLYLLGEFFKVRPELVVFS